MATVSFCFGDIVRLNDSRVGTIRFIGHTHFKKDALLYGIHLRSQFVGNNNGKINNREYFKCPKNHGVFVQQSEIKEIIKKHHVSASFSYNQAVQVLNIGKGRVKYIGLTHFGNNYWFGIELIHHINIKKDKNNNMTYYMQYDNSNIRYFNADKSKSIFVRSNQLRCIKDDDIISKKKNPLQYRIKRSMSFQRSTSTHSAAADIHDHDDQKHSHTSDSKSNTNSNDNTDRINQSMIAMMNSLDIPQQARPKMMQLSNEQKLFMIKQWFLTPTRNRYASKSVCLVNGSGSGTGNQMQLQRKGSANVHFSKQYKHKNVNSGEKQRTQRSIYPDHQPVANKIAVSTSTSDSDDMLFVGCVISKKKKKKKKYVPNSVAVKKRKNKPKNDYNYFYDDHDVEMRKKKKKKKKKSVNKEQMIIGGTCTLKVKKLKKKKKRNKKNMSKYADDNNIRKSKKTNSKNISKSKSKSKSRSKPKSKANKEKHKNIKNREKNANSATTRSSRKKKQKKYKRTH